MIRVAVHGDGRRPSHKGPPSRDPKAVSGRAEGASSGRPWVPAIKVTVYIPTLPTQASQRRNDFYLRIGVTCRPLPLVDIPRHQFPPVITLPNGTSLQRPADWK